MHAGMFLGFGYLQGDVGVVNSWRGEGCKLTKHTHKNDPPESDTKTLRHGYKRNGYTLQDPRMHAGMFLGFSYLQADVR